MLKLIDITANQTIQNQMQSDLRASKDIICRVQLAQILSASFLEKLPTSGESLRYCQSMQQRRRDRSKLILPNTNDLQKWADQKHSSFLVTESSTSQAAKDFLVELLQVIREARFPVLWALRFADYWESDLTCIDILRMLVLQVLQINPDALTTGSNPITMTHLREAVDETDWLSILNRALQGVQQIYIVLDADLLSHVTNHNRYLATRWVEGFPRTITGTVVKLFVSRYGVDEGYASRNWDSGGWVKLRTDMMGKRPPIRSKRQKPGIISRYNFGRAHRL